MSHLKALPPSEASHARDDHDAVTTFTNVGVSVSTAPLAAPQYAQKALLFPRCYFLLTLEEFERVVSPDHYGGSEMAMGCALAQVKMHGGRFLVQRENGSGRFATFDEAVASPQGQALPASLRGIFAAL